jgi:uncharacterized protein
MPVMQDYKRPQYNDLKNRIEEPRKFIQVIMGPRQVGKTTVVRQLTEDIAIPFHFASADEAGSADEVWIAQQWEAARLKLELEETSEILLVIDEIQKINNWSEAVKRHWDKDTRESKNVKVVLLGSARLLLQRGLTESLAGRFELIAMSHWSYTEMKEAFGFTPEQFVWFGGYPGAVALLSDESRWKDYIRHALIETTVSKDILMMTRIDKPALLKQLFELSCIYSGQILSFNKMLGQLQDAGNTTTLSHYLDLLDSAGLVTGLKNFSLAQVRSRASSPKLQVINTALLTVFLQYGFNQARLMPAEWGRQVESAVGAHLANATKASGLKLSYWRHRNDEVDFVLEKGDKYIGIEVKSGVTSKAPGMPAFVKKYNPHKILLVGASGIPWQQFLEMEPKKLF